MLSLEQLLPLILLFVLSISAIFNFVILRRPNLEKGSAYECGFQAFETPLNRKIEISFFMVAVSFLIFDVETILLTAWVVDPVWTLDIGIFITLLITTLLVELMEGALDINSSSSLYNLLVPIQIGTFDPLSLVQYAASLLTKGDRNVHIEESQKKRKKEGEGTSCIPEEEPQPELEPPVAGSFKWPDLSDFLPGHDSLQDLFIWLLQMYGLKIAIHIMISFGISMAVIMLLVHELLKIKYEARPGETLDQYDRRIVRIMFGQGSKEDYMNPEEYEKEMERRMEMERLKREKEKKAIEEALKELAKEKQRLEDNLRDKIADKFLDQF